MAVIMDGTGAFWAHLAKLRIVAEIMNTGHGSREFWEASQQVQEQVYGDFARAHAKLVVAYCPATLPDAWEQIQGTPYCYHHLD